MAKSKRKQTNELEFQGQVVVWLNDEITKRPGLKVDKATQEKPRRSSGKRSDLIVWTDRAAEVAFLAIELKTPSTPINDPVFFCRRNREGAALECPVSSPLEHARTGGVP